MLRLKFSDIRQRFTWILQGASLFSQKGKPPRPALADAAIQAGAAMGAADWARLHFY
jgi:hypothetical protein